MIIAILSHHSPHQPPHPAPPNTTTTLHHHSPPLAEISARRWTCHLLSSFLTKLASFHQSCWSQLVTPTTGNKLQLPYCHSQNSFKTGFFMSLPYRCLAGRRCLPRLNGLSRLVLVLSPLKLSSPKVNNRLATNPSTHH